MKQGVKVAYVSQFADMVGGGEHSLVELIEHLPDSIAAELILPARGALSQRAEKMGIPVNYLPMPKLGLATLPALWRWRKWLRQHSFDVVHANQSRAAFYAGFAALGSRTKSIFHCRISERDGLMDSMLMRLCDAIVCNSRAVAARFDTFSGKLQVIYNGVTRKAGPANAAITLPEDARLLLFVGRLSAEKQPQLALQLFEQLAERHSRLHLALLGGDDPHHPDFSEAIRRSAATSRFASRIHMPGNVDSVAVWYHRAELLVLTSRHEGFGRVLVEAMAAGVVPVAFSVGGVPEVVEDGVQGFLVAADDVIGMAKHIEKLLEDETLRAEMAERGRLRAALFSTDAHVAAISRFYRELLSGLPEAAE